MTFGSFSSLTDTVRASDDFSESPQSSERNSLQLIFLNSSEYMLTPYSDLNDDTMRSKSSVRS